MTFTDNYSQNLSGRMSLCERTYTQRDCFTTFLSKASCLDASPIHQVNHRRINNTPDRHPMVNQGDIDRKVISTRYKLPGSIKRIDEPELYCTASESLRLRQFLRDHRDVWRHRPQALNNH